MQPSNPITRPLLRLQSLLSLRRSEYPQEISTEPLTIVVPVSQWLTQENSNVTGSNPANWVGALAANSVRTAVAPDPLNDRFVWIMLQYALPAAPSSYIFLLSSGVTGVGSDVAVCAARSISGSGIVTHREITGGLRPVWVPAGMKLDALNDTAIAAGENCLMYVLVEVVSPGYGPLA